MMIYEKPQDNFVLSLDFKISRAATAASS